MLIDMRTTEQRAGKYDKKIIGRVLPGQSTHFTSAVQRQVDIEQRIKIILAKNHVPSIYNHFYMNFAKKLNQIFEKHKQGTAETEDFIEENKWVARGLDPNILWEIKKEVGFVPSWSPFRCDNSLLDGPDRLM